MTSVHQSLLRRLHLTRQLVIIYILCATTAFGKSGDSWVYENGCWRNGPGGTCYDGDKDSNGGKDTSGGVTPPPPSPDGTTTSGCSTPPCRKILCLHGGGGTGTGFQSELNNIITTAGDGYEFVFLTAPVTRRALWIRDPPNGKGQPTTASDWDADSTAALDAVVAAQGPFWGILGYSQGTAMAISYLAHAPVGTFQVAMVFCAYIPSTHVGLVSRIDAAAPFSLPTFIFMGERDSIITNTMTDDFATRFSNPTRSTSSVAGHGPPEPSDPTYNDIFNFMRAHQGASPVATPSTPTPSPTAPPTPSPTSSPTPPPTKATPSPTKAPKKACYCCTHWCSIAGDARISTLTEGPLRVDQIVPGHKIRGADCDPTDSTCSSRWCDVISNYKHGEGEVLGDFTQGHQVVRMDRTGKNVIVPHSRGVKRQAALYNIATECDVAMTQDGQQFTPFSTAFCNKETLSMPEYHKVFRSILRFTQQGGAKLRFLWDPRTWADNATHQLTPALDKLCSSILHCKDEESCGEFEADIGALVDNHMDSSHQRTFHEEWGSNYTAMSRIIIEVDRGNDTTWPAMIIVGVLAALLMCCVIVIGLLLLLAMRRCRVVRVECEVNEKQQSQPSAGVYMEACKVAVACSAPPTMGTAGVKPV